MIDLAPAIRTSLLTISDTVYTRRPVPSGATYPMIIVSEDIVSTDRDLIDTRMQFVVRDVMIYGQNDTTAHYREVESMAYAVFDKFHRRPSSIIVSGWHIVDVIARGPIAAPTDDNTTVGRVVTLSIRANPVV